ncbi:MAG: nickel pincer cofactor biosynthesis protein LarC [Bacillota bacterium]|nr:nickel pincer cofactor biosynthesis protein LarC [Bacillota bacterium]
MRVLYWDCFAGIAGDMALGSLIDAGADPASIRDALEASGLSGFDLEVARVQARGLAAARVTVRVTSSQPPRRLGDIRDLIIQGCFPPAARERALRVFTRLAEAEARVHGTRPEEVHFHEVGAVDALVEVIGACLALDALRIDRVIISPLPLSTGYTTCAHGVILPVPPPATLELLRGFPTRGTAVEGELVTPTGAALATALAAEAGPPPGMRIEAVGYGAGSREFTFPNVLRAIIGERREETRSGWTAEAFQESLVILETNIDDLNPEFYPHLTARLLDAGAREAYLTPVIMKKGRPGVVLTVLAREEDWRRLAGMMMEEAGTLGVRMRWDSRLVAPRQIFEVRTVYGPVRVKVAHVGGRVTQIKPEFEDCRARAAEAGVPVREVHAAASLAARLELPPCFRPPASVSSGPETGS